MDKNIDNRIDPKKIVMDIDLASTASVTTGGLKAARMPRNQKENNNQGNNKQQGNQQNNKKPTPVPNVPLPALNKSVRLMKEKIYKDESDAEGELKAKLLNKLKKYYEYFPQLRESAEETFTIEHSLAAIKAELTRCQDDLASESTFDNVKRADIFSNHLAEQVLLYFKVPVWGLGKEAEESQMIVWPELKEFAIKYSDFFSSGPGFRYFIKFLGRIQIVIQKNNLGKYTQPSFVRTPEEMSEDAQKKFDEKYNFI